MLTRVGTLLALMVFFTSLATGQAITASVHGRVSDKTGAVVVSATVTVTSTETGLSRSTKTNSTGEYEIAQLPVGQYKATVDAQSFQPQSQTVELVIGQAASLDFSLAPGAVKEDVVVVSGELPLVETTRTSIDSVIGYEQIHDLPVNGRQFIDFALLAPGVV